MVPAGSGTCATDVRRRGSDRGTTCTDVAAATDPALAVTVYTPGSSATKYPSWSTCAPGPLTLHRTGTALTAAPLASLVTAVSLTTSPVRAGRVTGSSRTVRTGFARTTIS